MNVSDSLIYSKRYKTLDEEYMEDYLFSDTDNVISIVKEALKGRITLHPEEAAGNKHIDQPGSAYKTEHVPDIIRLEKAEIFISKSKQFSERYHVSADIFKKKAGISTWLYFCSFSLAQSIKADFVDLLESSDEVTGISRPKEMENWCEVAIILDYMTHHSFVEDRELHPFE